MRRIHDAKAGSSGGTLPEAPERAEAPERERVAGRSDELERVLGVSGIGFCRVDAQRTIAGASSQFKGLFGMAPDGVLTWAQLEAAIAPEDREKPATALRSALEHGESADLILKTTWSAEGPRWASMRVRALADTRGRRAEALIVARDATPEQRAASALAEANLAERRARIAADAANRSKDEFLSVISHELRSPLNAILGWNRILAIKRADDPEVKAVAPRIEQSAKAQLKMVNDLLDLGRIGTGKLRITPRQMRLATLIGVAVDAIRPAAAAKGVELVVDTDAQRAQIFGDPDRLSQVIGNLLSNAMKFTPSGGRITVQLREGDGRAVLRVADTGQGIGADLLPHIFDRFRQGDSSTTRGAGGLGLGLTLVREIVALHGGTVSASSDGQDRGSEFEIALPAAPPDADLSGERPKRSHEPRPEQLSGLSILVVDDEADARAVVAETLRLEGAHVTIGDSVRAALGHLVAPGARFDVLVTDIGMPEEDGYSLVRKLRRLNDGRRVVAIALTGYASPADIEAAIDAGFDLHVPKPVDFDSFVPIIRRLADAR
jgi:signal transduction histidine kinase/ActR/RegA family two-component response regulator